MNSLLRPLALLALSLLAGCSSKPDTPRLPGRPMPPRPFRPPLYVLPTEHNQRFGNEGQPPVHVIEDACVLFRTYPHWREALLNVKRKWDIDPWYILAFIHQESSFNPHALSSANAYGFPQAKDDTWLWYQEKTSRWQASRERFDDASDFIGWYAHQNLRKNGVNLHDVAGQYLAYHEGLGGFERRSFLSKPWLLDISQKVADRALYYQTQVLNCQW